MGRFEEIRLFTAVFVIIIATSSLHLCDAKRGCSAFGHSCFGGHGKRMDPSASFQGASAPEEVAYDQQAGLRDVVFTAPRSNENIGSTGQGPPPMALLEAAAVLRRQQQQDKSLEGVGRTAVDLAPYLRQWLQAYRNTQDFRQVAN